MYNVLTGLVLPLVRFVINMKIFSRGLRPRLRLTGPNVPTVDIVIPCCNEELGIIVDTIQAALALDYPKHRYRVIVTDDGRSAEVANWVAEKAVEEPNLYYTSRPKAGREGYKAGNLNHALRYIDMLPQGRAEFLAGLDADMIAEKRWLRSMMAQVLQDAKIGIACPPQVCIVQVHAYIINSSNFALFTPVTGASINDFTVLLQFSSK
jgi:cellulose synthase/poly-beta-1,6-N-acetylglucosamine synthase-like glycosyltransferase